MVKKRLSPQRLKFALEYGIRKVLANQEGLKLMIICADEIHLLLENKKL
jgi:hypothetical protein